MRSQLGEGENDPVLIRCRLIGERMAALTRAARFA
jgi:hypothetical protein